ncbi:MAG: phospho-sugar mutase [Thermotogota bacterium]|nr:phospho-sugar mutase [Thermotogota bacterium]
MPKYEDLKRQYDRWLEASSGWMKEDLDSMAGLPFDVFKSELYERFSMEAEFGTGGLRSKIRAGTNGINDFWIKRICKAIRIHSKRVVIAYDTRRCSKDFAIEAATALSAGQCQVFLFDEPVPTPILSFAVKYLKCDTGIVITASHNPKEYNGFKLYDENGVQYIPDKVEQLNELIKTFSFLDKDKKIPNPEKIERVGANVIHAYYSEVFTELDTLKVYRKGEAPEISVIYTPLHGTGARFVPKIMTAYGMNVQVVEEQMIPDSKFPTVTVPNPEDPDAFKMALNKAKNMLPKPKALIATDPDADRLGVFIEYQGEYRPLTGNELGILFLDYILRKKGINDFKGKQVILKTIVTTDAVKPMAKSYNLNVYETLTGFKYLGNKSVELQSKGIDTLFSFEESYGYLFGKHAGDKDACSTAGLLALLLLDVERDGSLFTRLDKIRNLYGYYLERLLTHTAEGVDGMNKLKDFMRSLRTDKTLLNWEDGIRLKDYLREKGELKADVVAALFHNGDKCVFRPSGTEPKIKAYMNIHAQDKANAVNRLDWMEEKVKKLFDSYLN